MIRYISSFVNSTVMKENAGIIILGGVLVLLVLLIGCTATENTTTEKPVVQGERPVYVVGIDAKFPPYTYIEKDGTAQGFDVDSIRWIAEKEGFDIRLQPMAWDGIIPALQSGKIDMIYAGMTITDERKEMVDFSTPYWTINQSVAVHRESGKTMDDFNAGTLIIGAKRGTPSVIWVENNLISTGKMPAENLKLYDTFPEVVQDLQNKRLDAIIFDTPGLMDAIADKPLEKIGEIDTGEQYGIAVRKEDAELLAKINDGLSQLMKDPYWKTLQEKYDM